MNFVVNCFKFEIRNFIGKFNLLGNVGFARTSSIARSYPVSSPVQPIRSTESGSSSNQTRTLSAGQFMVCRINAFSIVPKQNQNSTQQSNAPPKIWCAEHETRLHQEYSLDCWKKKIKSYGIERRVLEEQNLKRKEHQLDEITTTYNIESKNKNLIKFERKKEKNRATKCYMKKYHFICSLLKTLLKENTNLFKWITMELEIEFGIK